MTPKEKAEELLTKMSKQTYKYQPYSGANYLEEEIGYEAGKKCALITTEEVIYQYFALNTYLSDMGGIDKQYKYWLEVKQEIEKL